MQVIDEVEIKAVKALGNDYYGKDVYGYGY
jgi:hypothetical protein